MRWSNDCSTLLIASSTHSIVLSTLLLPTDRCGGVKLNFVSTLLKLAPQHPGSTPRASLSHDVTSKMGYSDDCIVCLLYSCDIMELFYKV